MLAPYLKKLNSQKRVILASGSPRRKDILEKLGLKFEIVVSQFDELLDKSTFSHPKEYVLETAKQKALDVYNNDRSNAKKSDIIISCDTIVVLGTQIIEKPRDVPHAKEMLQSLSNKDHCVYSAISILLPAKMEQDSETAITSFVKETTVTFDTLEDDVIDAYIATGIPMDKAGGYGIQDPLASSFVTGIKGCYYNVVGFPVNLFCVNLIKLLKDSSIKLD
mmetsp:Transcript_15686/g.17439  ORF Transcript_15686/g.17439 Transcript_15686/m.17439 type:complete len:221 (+) Transcript_15686:14-676(+)